MSVPPATRTATAATDAAPRPAADAPGPVVLYDGVCGLCDRAVQRLLARDREGLFRFATLQGEFARAVLARHGYSNERPRPDSLILVEAPGTRGEAIRFRSEAVLGIVARLPGAASRWGRWLRLLPRPVRDLAYDLVARVRYRVFGRLAVCRVPDPQIRRRFID